VEATSDKNSISVLSDMYFSQCFVILYLPSVVPVSLDIQTGDDLVIVTDMDTKGEKIEF
jgi:hypothetical protein